MSALAAPVERSQLDETIEDYLAQISLSLRPASVRAAAGILGRFALFLQDAPEVRCVARIGRREIESYKGWLRSNAGRSRPLVVATVRAALSTLRMFCERIIEWGWEDAPIRVAIFAGDMPKADEPLPKSWTTPPSPCSCERCGADPRPLARLVVEPLPRTGMRVGEVCALEADAVVRIGETHWLRIPVGKLHNDRYIPLHPSWSSCWRSALRRTAPTPTGRVPSIHCPPCSRKTPPWAS